jgi:hypothetical protein
LQLFSFEVESAADFGNDNGRRVEAAEGCEKPVKVGLLGSTANPGIDNDFSVVPTSSGNIRLDVVPALSSRSPDGFNSPFFLPPAEGELVDSLGFCRSFRFDILGQYYHLNSLSVLYHITRRCLGKLGLNLASIMRNPSPTVGWPWPKPLGSMTITSKSLDS